MTQDYMLLITEREAYFDNFTPEQQEDLDERHRRFAAEIVRTGGEILFSDPLAETMPGSRFTPAPDGAVLVTDGPYAETKEIVLGYYKIRVRDEAHARELAAQCPTAGYVDLRLVRPT